MRRTPTRISEWRNCHTLMRTTCTTQPQSNLWHREELNPSPAIQQCDGQPNTIHPSIHKSAHEKSFARGIISSPDTPYSSKKQDSDLLSESTQGSQCVPSIHQSILPPLIYTTGPKSHTCISLVPQPVSPAKRERAHTYTSWRQTTDPECYVTCRATSIVWKRIKQGRVQLPFAQPGVPGSTQAFGKYP